MSPEERVGAWTSSSPEIASWIALPEPEGAEGLERNRYYDPSIGRYLQPEPLLQKPATIRLLAKLSGTLPDAYAYAHNNPVNFTDPNGLMSWRQECPAIAGFPNRGFVITSDDVFGTRVLMGSGTVGLDNWRKDGSRSTACEDLAVAEAAYRENFDKWHPGANVEFGLAADCWAALVKEIREACDKEKCPKK